MSCRAGIASNFMSEYNIETKWGKGTVYLPNQSEARFSAKGLLINGVGYEVTLNLVKKEGIWVMDSQHCAAKRVGGLWSDGATPAARNVIYGPLVQAVIIWLNANPIYLKKAHVNETLDKIAHIHNEMAELEDKLEGLRNDLIEAQHELTVRQKE
jgi:hypothetical protein